MEMTNDRMTNDEPHAGPTVNRGLRHSSFCHSLFVIRHSSFVIFPW